MKFTWAYAFLFVYIIAAIVFWGYSLRKQNELFYILEIEKLELKIKDRNSPEYKIESAKIKDKRNRKIKQYWGEEATNLFVILLSASVVYMAYYKQQQLTKLQNNFMLSVTHELKTPIAGVKLAMQTLQKHKLDETTRQKLIYSAIEEANRLGDLCNNILLATQLEERLKQIHEESVDIVALTHTTCKEFSIRFPNLELEVQTKIKEFTINADTMLWKMVMSNLIENARKYSPKDQKVIVTITQVGSNIKWAVEDKGIGITDDEKNKIFTKFYRIGNENTRKTKGTGLGLYIVKKIVQLYKYDISVKNNTPLGSIFEITFANA